MSASVGQRPGHLNTVAKRYNWRRFWRGEGPQSGSIHLNRKRIYILPTAEGLLFALILWVMLFGSLNYSNSLGFALTFTLAAMVVVSILHTYANLAGLSFHLENGPGVFAGEPAEFYLRCRNPDGRTRHRIHFFQYRENRWQVTDFAGDHTQVFDRATQRRGRVDLGRLRIESRYPLGLIRAWSYLEFDTQTWVFPSPADEAPPPIGAEGPLGQLGRLGEEEFAGLEEYRPGQSLGRIHWKQSARQQELVVKAFESGGSLEPLWLSDEGLQDHPLERRLEILCRWVLDAQQAQRRYGLRLAQKNIAPNQGEAHMYRCLETLACFGEIE